MPELPEVETVVRGLRPDLVGRSIVTARVDQVKVLGDHTLAQFNARITGKTVQGIHRRGKYICISLEDSLFLVVHLRMTGRMYFSDSAVGDDRWVRVSLKLGNGQHLIFSDARRFGRVTLHDSLDFLETKLGPEPLDIEAAHFRKILRGSKRAVKAFLLDQAKIAGVGNIYADESLFMAGIRPTRPVDKLKPAEREKLGECVQIALSKGIDHEGASINWYRKPDGTEGESQDNFLVYGRGGEPCYTCGTAITKIVVGQRGTHYCHNCQR